ncbi:MAG: IS1595 family transposase [Actinomycetia bacterium]|nr:IS1595 family transposase [Actinomycetes bacterium]
MAGSKGPGRGDREGISLIELYEMFPNDAAAEAWFEERRWPGGNRFCPDCGSERYTIVKSRKPMPYRCKDCRRHFSVTKGTVMQSTKLGLRQWAFGFYLVATSLKGVSSIKLHRDLRVTQKTAWHLAQRIRASFTDDQVAAMAGPIEIDEGYFGGLEANKHASKKQKAGRGTVGKTAVVAAKDRPTGKVTAKVVEATDAETLQPFVVENTTPGAEVYTDDHGAYKGIPGVEHKTVRNSVGEYVDGMAHTNGVESFWAQLKRGYHGTFHQVSRKHLQRYVDEFSGRHNIRSLDTADQMAALARGTVGKRLTHRQLTA